MAVGGPAGGSDVAVVVAGLVVWVVQMTAVEVVDVVVVINRGMSTRAVDMVVTRMGGMLRSAHV